MVYFEVKQIKEDSMEEIVFTVKGQIVVPPKLRREVGNKKRTRVPAYEKNGANMTKPISDEYIRSMAGMAGTKGRLLKALKEEKTRAAKR
jgi:bifunctional DNA-binding transcriptional regulator/antitoxin component of YhaV-PrlF toxin-antitoxin module